MLSAPIDLALVRRLFATPARVAGSEFLRREVATRMHEKLALVNLDAKTVLDAGCGDGADLPLLSARFPNAHLIGLDGSFERLRDASFRRSDQGGALSNLLAKWMPTPLRKPLQMQAKWDYLCDDFSQVSMAGGRVDMLWSNLALHWHPQPDQVLKEWFRLLRTNGLVMFSCFGPDTLIELKQAFAEVDAYPHSLPFVDMHDYGDMLVSAGFATPVMDVERITLRYQTTAQLFADVRALGGLPLSDRRQSLMGKNAYQKLLQMLESQRESDGRIPMSIELVFGHAFKPQPSKLVTGEAIIRLDFPKKSR